MIAEWNYILRDGEPVPEPDLMTWGRWFGAADRTVARDELPGGVTVSTVFLGIDHAFGGGGPVLWETMIFGGPHDEFQERYRTQAEALAGHARALALASEGG